jgi:hypothetical protein
MTDPVERLRRHAFGTANGATVSEATATRNRSQIETATADFIEALDEYNRSLNGAVPSAGVGDPAGEDAVSRRAAYAVAEAARMLRDAGAADCASRVDIAWASVLAGDIDDIREHVAGRTRPGVDERHVARLGERSGMTPERVRLVRDRG